MKPYCFIAQPFDKGVFDQRFKDVIVPAVKSCGLEPYRMDLDNTVDIPFYRMEERIERASLIIAEITTDNPNVWYELGYALALRKEVIMVCSDERTSDWPFDVRHRNILSYNCRSLNDFKQYRAALKAAIMARIKGNAENEASDELTPSELLVLKFIARDQKNTYAITPEEKILQTSLDHDTVQDCLKALIRGAYLEYSYSTDGGEGYYHITSKGENYLRNK